MSKRAVRAVVVILAWAFIVGSLWPLVGDLKWPPHQMSGDQENNYVLRAVVDEKEYISWGLTYVGESGHWLRLAEIAGVLVAALLSLLPQDGARRIGLFALVAWAGLWLGNALRIAVIAPVWIFVVVAAVIFVFFMATVIRARMSWTKPGRSGRADNVDGHALAGH